MKYETDWTPLFDRALDEEFGLKVESTNPKRHQVVLCEVMKGRPEYNDLLVCLPSIPGYVFITKRSVELEE